MDLEALRKAARKGINAPKPVRQIDKWIGIRDGTHTCIAFGCRSGPDRPCGRVAIFQHSGSHAKACAEYISRVFNMTDEEVMDHWRATKPKGQFDPGGKCPRCNGKGVHKVSIRDQTMRDCEICGGNGITPDLSLED